MTTLIDICLLDAGAFSRLDWAVGQTFRVPASLVPALAAAGDLVDGDLVLGDVAVEGVGSAAAELREMRMYTANPPVSGRLPFNYHAVPAVVRSAAASLLGRIKRRSVQRWAAFPRWPLDLSVDFLSDIATGPAAAKPEPQATPVVLSHDIDTREGLNNLRAHFLPLERQFEATSTCYLVPFAWPLADDEVAALQQLGARIGVHGYDHANRTAFADPDERAQRLQRIAHFAAEHTAAGYRAPSLLRTAALLEGLAPIFRYDSSIPTSGGLFPVPNNGCATARPFRIGEIWELPVSMPRDGSLRFLGHSPSEILNLWIDCAVRIHQARGTVALLTHCERQFSGTPKMLDIYRAFLEFIAADDRFVWASEVDLIPC